jgi:hypothetical protein
MSTKPLHAIIVTVFWRIMKLRIEQTCGCKMSAGQRIDQPWRNFTAANHPEARMDPET